MDMSSLFSADDGLGSVLSSGPTPHISFKAGLLNRDPTTNRITADPRKGVFQIVTSPEDQLLHLQWRARNQSSVDHDLILFNAETEMKPVTSAPSTARVFVLKWREADNRMFFWMQEKDASGDARLIEQVNAILEHGPDVPPLNQQNAGGAVTSNEREFAAESTQPPSDAVAIPEASLEPPSRSAPEASTVGHNREPVSIDQIRAALQQQTSLPRTTSAMEDAQRELVMTTPTLTDLLSSEALNPALENPAVQAALPELLQHLPEQDRSCSVGNIVQLLRSPSLRAQADALSSALRSGQANELIRSFELPASQSAFGLQAFLDALQTLERRLRQPPK